MTTTALELCEKLGYPDAGSHESASLAEVLIEDLKAFAKDKHERINSETMATLYMLSPVKVFKYPYNWTPDGMRISELLSELFSLIMASQAMQHEVSTPQEVDSAVGGADATVTTSIMDINFAGTQETQQDASQTALEDCRRQSPDSLTREAVGILVNENNNDASMTSVDAQDVELTIGPERMVQNAGAHDTSHKAGPITKLALRVPNLVASLLSAGFTEPYPVVSFSEAELMHMLDEWMIKHPDEDPPGSRILIPGQLQRTYKYAVTIYLITTSEEVNINARQIMTSRMIYVLSDGDGACMVVRLGKGNNTYRREYHGWLGDDLGFTPKPIASSHWAGYQESAKEVSFGHDHQSNTIVDDALAQSSATNKIVVVKQEPTLTQIRQSTLKRRQAERQTLGLRWRSETPPLSSMDTVKKFRWPPQYVSPTSTPLPEKHKASDPKSYKRRNIGGQLPNCAHSRSSTPEFMSESPVTPPQGVRRSSRATSAAHYQMLSPPKTPKKTKFLAKNSSTASAPIVTQPQSSAFEASLANHVTIHLFLSDESLGAIPITLNECNTSVKFFNQALSAWNLLGLEDQARDMAAVSVTIDGVQWPMVLPWGNSQAFQRMLGALEHAQHGTITGLEVRVKCIKK